MCVAFGTSIFGSKRIIRHAFRPHLSRARKLWSTMTRSEQEVLSEENQQLQRHLELIIDQRQMLVLRVAQLEIHAQGLEQQLQHARSVIWNQMLVSQAA